MKQLIKNAAVVALLMLTSDVEGCKLQHRSAHRVYSHSHHGKQGMNSEDVDADDQDISTGPVKNDDDVAVYQETFISNGQNVHSLNQQEEHEKQKRIACEGGQCNQALDEDLLPNMSKAYENVEKQEQAKVQPKPVISEPSGQQKRQMYAQEHSHQISDHTRTMQQQPPQFLEQDDKATIANTNRWARTKDVDIGEIETVQTGVANGYMSVTDANDMLHAVVQSSQQEQYDNAHPSSLQKSEEDLHKELISQAEEVDTQIDDLEHMKFDAKDLNAFTAKADVNTNERYPEQNQPKPAPPAPEGPKNFYEQIYAKQN